MHRRGPFDTEPDTVKGMAEEYGRPVVLCDWQITRRQRVHTVIFPDHRPPYSDVDLVNVLEAAIQEPGETVVFAHVDLRGRTTACYVAVTPITQRSPNHGESTRPPAQSERTGSNR